LNENEQVPGGKNLWYLPIASTKAEVAGSGSEVFTGFLCSNVEAMYPIMQVNAVGYLHLSSHANSSLLLDLKEARFSSKTRRILVGFSSFFFPTTSL
jgi:hypothetical protein